MSFGKVDKAGIEPTKLGPQERITYHGELSVLFGDALSHYSLGSFVSCRPKQNGYEGFNLELETSSGMVFAKCFASWRSEQECTRYLEMVERAYRDGVRTPKIYHNLDDKPLTKVFAGGAETRLCLMEYLDRGNIWESSQPLSRNEQAEVIRQASRINKTMYRPTYVYDSWAIPNLADNYAKNRNRIHAEDKVVIEKLLAQLGEIDVSKLPHAFVHGDIRTTNVMRHRDGQIYIIDFSVANYYPRVVELAVLCSDALFEPDDIPAFADTYAWALDVYQQDNIKLDEIESKILPLFIKLAHAANVIGASSADSKNYISQAENDHWLRLSQKGLHLFS